MDPLERHAKSIADVLRVAIPRIRAQRRQISRTDAEDAVRQEARRQGVDVPDGLVEQVVRGALESRWQQFRRIVLKRA